MTEENLDYSPGDWIVHCYHGVGRIKAAERKQIGGKETTYFRIEMADSTIWIPVELMSGGQIRSVSKKDDFQQAIEVLARKPGAMDANMNIRRIRINEVIADNQPLTTARLVRDLRARQHEKGMLNDGERRAYRALSSRLTQEWAICMEMSIEEVRDRLEHV